MLIRVVGAVLALSIGGVPAARASGPWVSCFTLAGVDCEGLLVRQIADARSSILVQAYSFTSRPIARALIEARSRGVDVRVILDRSENRTRSFIGELRQAGIPVWLDGAENPLDGIQHDKVMVFDQAVTMTGSYNFTVQASRRNAENMLLIRDAELAGDFSRNWERRRAVSEPVR